MKKVKLRHVLLGCSLGAAPLALHAQLTGGSVSGTVTDSSGAAIPNAQVTILNPSSGFKRVLKTNGAGEYNAPQLPPSNDYVVDAVAPSFKETKVSDVHVDVATTTNINVSMAVGAAAEQVTVQADRVNVQTDSASLGQVIDGRQVKQLPLNGRSFVELTQLQPGVSAANNFDTKNKGLQGGVDMSVNGNPTTNNLFLIDGVNNNDVGSNRTILIYPSNEAIAEFKMLTNSYTAEYGQASGAIISIITRSGTNKFHGSAFYDGRNDALDAYTYFAAQNASPSLPESGKDKLRRNDWGYSIGGPIKHDKLFFFFSEEWNHEIRGRTVASCVPTAAELGGDFTQSFAGTTTSCSQTPANIPANLQANGNPHVLNALDPTALTFMKIYPLPTRPTLNSQGDNWSVSLPTALYWREENVRGDYNLSQSEVITGRYTQDTWSNPAYNAGYWGDDPYPALNSSWAQPSKSIMGRLTSTISNTLVNNAAFQYSNNRIVITAGGTDPSLLATETQAIPTLYPASIKHASEGLAQINLGSYGATSSLIAPWQNQLNLYSFQDDATKTAGRNVIKFGIALDWDGKDEDTGPASSERPVINTGDSNLGTGGIATGNNFANFLVPNNVFLFSETSTNVRAMLRWRDYAFYATDNFKLTPRITVNAGLRYSIMPPTYQPDGQETNFQPALYNPALPASDACNGLWVVPGQDPCGASNREFGTSFSSGTKGPNKYLQNVNYHLFAPRVGVNWDVKGDGQTVLSAAGGEFFQRERVSRYTLVANAPFALNESNYSRTLGGATPATLTGGTASPAGGYDARDTVPYSWQWNLQVQQSLGSQSLFSLAYVGNKGTHLTSSYDINQIPQQSWEQAAFVNGSAQTAFRPFPNYGTLTWWTRDGNSSYQALQALLKTRLRTLQLTAAYTFSHSISDIILDDSSGGLGTQTRTYYPDPRLDRGNGDTNRPNNFVLNAIYDLPTLSGHSDLVKESLGQWELSGILSAADGNSFTVYQGGVSENTSNVVANPAPYTQNGVVIFPTAGALNALAQTGYNPMQRPLVTAGQSCTAGRHGPQIVNPNAFTLIGYQIGTIPSNTESRGFCGGPNYNNTDFSVDKNWLIKQRVTMQFRLDFFDFFNHANFSPAGGVFTPIQSVNCGAADGAGLYQPCSVNNNVITAQTLNTGFGASNTLIGGNASRQIQYTLHFNF